MSILDHQIISERYFFPRRDAVPNPTWVDVSGARLACFEARNGHPFTIVHFHGNGEVVADYVPDFVELCDDLGADIFLAEYRGYGQSTGTPLMRGMLDDVEQIFEAIGRPPEEIIVFGRSVGSIYAIEFASRYPVAGLVLESGIAEPGERILMRASPDELGTTEEALDAEVRQHFDHRAKLAGRDRPTLIMHARQDSMVDFGHAVNLSTYPMGNVRLVLFPHGDHNTIFGINREQYIAELRGHIEICGAGGRYAKSRSGSGDETWEGSLDMFEDTREHLVPPRSGPGQTRQLTAVPTPDKRLGPGDTVETEIRRGHDDD